VPKGSGGPRRRVSERPASERRPRSPARSGTKEKGSPPPTRLRPWWWIVALALVGASCVFALGMWFVRPHGGRRGAIRVSLGVAARPDDVALALFRAGAVDRPWLFSWVLAVTGATDRIPRRTLLLRDDLSPRALLRALAHGGSLVRVTIPEGYNRFEIAQRLAREGVVTSADAFLSATEDPALLARVGVRARTCEGYLFPDTYDLYPDSAPDELVDRMVQNLRRRLAEARNRQPVADPRVQQLALDDHGVLTLASLVEEEAGVPEDRPRVSAVFFNRMTSARFTPRLLQSDPTVVYGCRVERVASCEGVARTGRVSITRAMLDDASNPYNTYRHEGLPPGPISNPGRASIEAALRPAAVDALYFVAAGEGRSAFAATLAEHNANVQRYLRRR
jgi:UPF0755 protein